MQFTLRDTAIDFDHLRSSMQRVDAGGFCTFEGWVRNHHLGKDVTHLVYEAYRPLALKQGAAVLDEAFQKFDILDAVAEHRVSKLNPGELAVWVGVSSVHRDAAFEACRYIIDEIKATVPIWKHEFYTDGTDVWVDPTACHCDHRHDKEDVHA